MTEFGHIVGNQLRLRGAVGNRRPLNHYICGGSNLLELASLALHTELPTKGFTVLPDITHEVEPRDLRFQGTDFFRTLYEKLRGADLKGGAPLTTVQFVRIPDISPCYVNYESSSQPASHLFIQIPLEGNDSNPSPVERILRTDVTLPRVVALHHLGYGLGEEVFAEGYRDIVIGHFKDGVWDQERFQ